MEIKPGTRQLLNLLNIISWIIFIGLCIDAGGYIFNTFYALSKPVAAQHFWKGVNLSALYSTDKGHFITQGILISITALMKAGIFYLIIYLFYDKKFNISRPFSASVSRLIFNISYLCFGAAVFSFWGMKYAAWIEAKNIVMPDIHKIGLGGSDIWLFMAIVLLVIGQVFKKGTELQTENDLTV